MGLEILPFPGQGQLPSQRRQCAQRAVVVDGHAVGKRPAGSSVRRVQVLGKVGVVAEVPQQPAVGILREVPVIEEETDRSDQPGCAVQPRIACERQQLIFRAVEHVAQLGVEQGLQFRGRRLGLFRALRPTQQQSLLQRGIVLAILARHGGVGALVHDRLPGVGVHRTGAGGQDRGLAAEHVADGLHIALERHVLAADHLVQEPGLVQKFQTVAVDVERAVVEHPRLLVIPGLLEHLRLGPVDVDHPGDVVDHLEGPLGAGDVFPRQQRLADVDIHLRRQLLAQTDQAAPVLELPVDIAAAGAEPAKARVRRGHGEQFTQHRRAPQARFRQRVLQRQEGSLGIALLAGDVGQKLIQIKPVCAGRDALQDHAPGPGQGIQRLGVRLLEECRGADQVQYAVHRHNEVVVLDGVLGEELQYRHRLVGLAVVVHDVGQQQQVVAVLGLLHQRPPIGLDRLIDKTRRGENAGLELAGYRFFVVRAQLLDPALNLTKPLIGPGGEIERQQVQDDALDVIEPVVGVDLVQAAQGLVVGRIVLQQHVHVRQQLLMADRVLAHRLGILVNDLGRRQLVAGFHVNAHQEIHVVAVGGAQHQHSFELHRHVTQGAQLGRQQQQLAFGKTAPRRALDANPDVAPQIQRLGLAIHDRVQPGQTHLIVVTELPANVPDGLEHTQRFLRPAQSLISIGQFHQLGGVGGQELLEAFERVKRRFVIAAVQPGLEQEQQGAHIRTVRLQVALDHRHAFIDKAHRNHQTAALDQYARAFAVALLKRLPHGQRRVVIGDVEIVRRQAVIPLRLGGLGVHHPAILAHHRVRVAGCLIQRNQTAALGNVGFRTFQLAIQFERLRVIFGLDQGLHAQAQQVLVCGIARGQVGQQERQFIGAAVRLGQQAQCVEAIHANRRVRIGEPGLLAGQLMRPGAQRPLRQAQILPVEPGRPGQGLVQLNRPLRTAQQRQHHGGLVAEGLVALRRQFLQDLDVARTDIHHCQAHADQPLLVALVVGLGRPLIPLARRVLIAAGIQ